MASVIFVPTKLELPNTLESTEIDFLSDNYDALSIALQNFIVLLREHDVAL